MNRQAEANHLESVLSEASDEDHDSAGILARVRSIAFRVLVVLFSLFLIAAFNLIFAFVILMLLPESALASIFGPGADLSELAHRIHMFTLSVFLWGMLIGTVLQLRRAEDKIGPMLMALAVPISLFIGELAGGIYTVGGTAPILLPLVVIALLHPKRGELFRIRRLNWPMVGLTVVVLGLLTPYASRHLQLQRMGIEGDLHGQAGHWSYMVSFVILIGLWALIGSTDRKGWMLPAIAASIASVILAIQSLLYPDYYSAVDAVMATAMILWAILFIAASVRRARTDTVNSRS